MRKFIICLIGAIILSNCKIEWKKAEAQQPSKGNSQNIMVDHYTIDDMDYAVFTVVSGGTYNSGTNGVSVVNVTRDKLQCEIIKANLKKFEGGFYIRRLGVSINKSSKESRAINNSVCKYITKKE